MNKNNILNNISILILLLLILVFSYININNNKVSMIGGAKCEELKEIVNKIMKKDKLFNLVFGTTVSKVVYGIIVLILLILAYRIGLYMYRQEGIVVGGQNFQKGMALSQYAGPFFKTFTQVTMDKYMFKNDPKNRSKVTTQEDLDNYDSFIKQLKSAEYKGLAKTFCNKVKPFDPCTCEGATDNPNELNGGRKRTGDDANTDYFKINGCTPITPEAQQVINQKKEASQHFFGAIPKCCCDQPDDLPSGCKSKTTAIKDANGKELLKIKDEKGDCANVNCEKENAKIRDTKLNLTREGIRDLDYKAGAGKITNITSTPTPISTDLPASVQGSKKDTFTSNITITEEKKDLNIISKLGKILAYYIS